MIIYDFDKRLGQYRNIELRTKFFEDRSIWLTDHITREIAEEINSQLFILDTQNDKDIFLFMNCPGGEVVSGLSIIDVMHTIRSDVSTIALGQCSSMACIILSAGCKGKRMAYVHSEIMAHTVSSIVTGKEADIEVSAQHTKRLNDTLMAMLAENTGKSVENIRRITQHDYFMTAQEALSMNIVDYII